MQGEHEQGHADENLDGEGRQDDFSPIEAIRGQTARQREQEGGKKLRQADHAQGEGTVRERVDLPAHGHAEHHHRHRGTEARGHEEKHVAVSENGRGVVGGHGGYLPQTYRAFA